MFSESVMACVGPIGVLGVIFGFIVVMRYLSYRETLALAEKGLVKPIKGGNGNGNGGGKDTLRWGIVITALGLALCLGMFPIGFMDRGVNGGLVWGPWMLLGLLPTFFGLALIFIYALTHDNKSKSKDQAPPSDFPPAV